MNATFHGKTKTTKKGDLDFDFVKTAQGPSFPSPYKNNFIPNTARKSKKDSSKFEMSEMPTRDSDTKKLKPVKPIHKTSIVKSSQEIMTDTNYNSQENSNMISMRHPSFQEISQQNTFSARELNQEVYKLQSTKTTAIGKDLRQAQT